jgi:hypothetical protein
MRSGVDWQGALNLKKKAEERVGVEQGYVYTMSDGTEHENSLTSTMFLSKM